MVPQPRSFHSALHSAASHAIDDLAMRRHINDDARNDGDDHRRGPADEGTPQKVRGTSSNLPRPWTGRPSPDLGMDDGWSWRSDGGG